MNLTRDRTPLASMANISIILYLLLFSWFSWLYGISFSLTIHSQQLTAGVLIALNCSLIVDCCRFLFLRRLSRYIYFRLHICKLGNALNDYEVCHWMLMRKCLLALLMLMLVILMLILMLLNLNTGYTDTCLLYTSPSPRDLSTSRMPSSAWKKYQQARS